MGRKKAETQPEVQDEAPKKKRAKLDIEELRKLAETCPSRAAGELLLETIQTYTEARIAYKEAAKNLRLDVARARARK